MNGKYTFMGLLNSINSGNQPKKIEYGHDIYEWDQSIGEYRNHGGGYLSEEAVHDLSMKDMTGIWAFSTVSDIPVLTEEEKTFLKSFVTISPSKLDHIAIFAEEPFKKIVFYSRGLVEESMEVTRNCFMGMQLTKVYTLKELGLDDD